MKTFKAIPFFRSAKNMKYLEIHLIKDKQALHCENYKVLLRKIKALYEWRAIPWSWIRRFTIKTSILPKLVCKFITILTPIPIDFFLEDIDKRIVKLLWKCKRTRVVKTVLKKKKLQLHTIPFLLEQLNLKRLITSNLSKNVEQLEHCACESIEC